MSKQHHAQAGLLLEVVVAMTVMVTAMGFMGAQLCTCLNITMDSEDQMRAAKFTDYVLALIEFDKETQELIFTDEEEVEWEFPDNADEESYWRLAEQYPGYFWRVEVTPAEPQMPELDLKLVKVEILYQNDPELYDDIDSARVVREVAFLRAPPAKIDTSALQQIDPTQLQQLADQSPEVADMLAMVMPMLTAAENGELSMQDLAGMVDAQTLQTLMPMLQAFIAQSGGDPAEILQQFQSGGGMGAGMQQFITGTAGSGGGGRQGMPRLPGMPGGEGRGGGRGARGGGEGRGPGGEGGARPGDGGGRRGGGGSMSIEDLIRMRDQFQREEGG